jgi:hypothetical protein
MQLLVAKGLKSLLAFLDIREQPFDTILTIEMLLLGCAITPSKEELTGRVSLWVVSAGMFHVFLMG